MSVRDWARIACSARLFLLLALSLVPLTLSGCGEGAHADSALKAKPADLPVLKAEVFQVQPTTWPVVVRTQGSLIADEVTIVGAELAGRVNEVNFDLGDAIKKGAILAVIEQADFRLQVSLAEAQLLQSRAALGLGPTDPVENLDPEGAPPVREAKAMWEETRARIARMRQLQVHARNTVTQDEMDQAVAAEAAASARHAAAINAVREKIAQISVRASERNVAQQRLTDTVIHAPFDGLVQERHIGHGAYVQVGDPIATLVRTSVIRFRGTMPERSAHQLAMGQQAKLKIEGVTHARIAKVTRISPGVSENSRSLVFEATLPNHDSSSVLASLGPAPAAHGKMDLNGDGLVLEEEFARYVVGVSRESIDLELARVIFQNSDEDEDGQLSQQELEGLQLSPLRTGSFAEAEVIVDPAAEAIVVPRSALTEFAGAEKVWKLVDGIAKEHVVQTARRTDREVEIVRGLQTGDRVLLDAAKGRVARIDAIESAVASSNAAFSDAAEEQSSDQAPDTQASHRAVNR
jgi:multidrug efflux pump subunit AcrA (membrane-fusion protein)